MHMFLLREISQTVVCSQGISASLSQSFALGALLIGFAITSLVFLCLPKRVRRRSNVIEKWNTVFDIIVYACRVDNLSVSAIALLNLLTP